MSDISPIPGNRLAVGFRSPVGDYVSPYGKG